MKINKEKIKDWGWMLGVPTFLIISFVPIMIENEKGCLNDKNKLESVSESICIWEDNDFSDLSPDGYADSVKSRKDCMSKRVADPRYLEIKTKYTKCLEKNIKNEQKRK